MTNDLQRGTATIHRFPTGGRAGLAGLVRPAKASVAVPTASFGSGWYHDAAIKAAAKDANVRP